MDKEQVEKHLQSLAINDAMRPQAAIMREQMPAIIDARTAGVSHRDIHQTLVSFGLQMTFESYQTTFYRIRKQVRKSTPKGDVTRQPRRGTKEEAEELATKYMNKTKPNPILDQLKKEETK